MPVAIHRTQVVVGDEHAAAAVKYKFIGDHSSSSSCCPPSLLKPAVWGGEVVWDRGTTALVDAAPLRVLVGVAGTTR